jgi:DNA-binding response OmpR family regulator
MAGGDWQIRQKKGLKKVPIVAVSAHDSPESRIEALAAGCDEYVTKPIDLTIYALLERFVSQAKRSQVATDRFVPESLDTGRSCTRKTVPSPGEGR